MTLVFLKLKMLFLLLPSIRSVGFTQMTRVSFNKRPMAYENESKQRFKI